MDSMNDVLALQLLSSDGEEATTGGVTADNAISNASALVCDGRSHLSLTVCD